MPRVSVLLPVRNGGALLEAALGDLARQTFRDVEVVVVDDGSDDETPARLGRFVEADPLRRRALRQAPSGIVAALERGRAAARGEILLRMDADDRCHPDRVRRQVAFLDAHPGIDVVGTQIHVFPRAARTLGMERYEAWQNGLLTHDAMAEELLVESPLCHPSVAMRREALDRVGGYRDGDFPEDYDLWLRMEASGARFAKLPGRLTLWREGPTRLTRTGHCYGPEALRAAKLRYLTRPGGPLPPDGAPREALVWGAGREGKPWLKALGAAGVGVSRVVELDPRKLGQVIHGARAVRPEALPAAGALPLVVAVGAPGARAEIRAWLRSRGWVERRDFFCVA